MFIKELILLTKDIRKTKEFYNGLMELPVTEETGEKISFSMGDSILIFLLTEKYTSPFYHVAFAIPNNKLEEALNWVSKRANVLPYSDNELIADFTGWNAKAFYFHDHQQNILEFITHFDLDTHDGNTFSPASIKNICEIGIVTDDVSSTCKTITEQYNIQPFPKGPFLKDFAVMGDANGLLIVSKTNRGWLPTGRPSEKFPVKVVVQINNQLNELSF